MTPPPRSARLRGWRAAWCAFVLGQAGAFAAGLTWEQSTLLREGSWETEQIDASFRFRNDGPADVEVTRIESSCGCLLTSLPRTRYAPGESGTLQALIDVSDQEGTEEKLIRVWTRDVATPQALTLRVSMPRWIAPSPPVVWWLIGAPPVAKEVRLTVNPASGVRVQRVRSSHPALTVELLEPVDGEPARLRVRPESTMVPLQARIELVAVTPAGRQRMIPISATVR